MVLEFNTRCRCSTSFSGLFIFAPDDVCRQQLADDCSPTRGKRQRVRQEVSKLLVYMKSFS